MNQKKSLSDETSEQEKLDAILDFARNCGATCVARVSPTVIKVEDHLADYCLTPKCPHYGLSMSCPPNVAGPAAMRNLLRECNHAIVLKIEVDYASLHGEERPQVMRLLHEISAAVELEAVRQGYTRAKAFAGGSCKVSFCPEDETCQVLSNLGPCRHPDAARPSMSGFGINVGALMEAAGWSDDLFPPKNDDGTAELSWVAGLVLL